MKLLRIFAASPSDTATERAKVGTVASTLKPLADNLGIILDVADWSRVVPDMGRPEKVILEQLKPTLWDVFIGILWHRFGTPPAAKDGRTQEDYLSGTEEEFKTAYRMWEQCHRPRIMIYRCTRPIPPDVLDLDQFKRVKEYFAQFDAVKGEHPGLYQSFNLTKSFERLLLDNLQKLLIEYGEEIRGKPVSAEVVHALTPCIPDNLPRRASFFGRDNDIDTTLRALDPEDRTWGVLVDGIGGIGKTALAVEAAHRSKENGLFDAFIYVSAKRNILNPGGICELFPVAQTLAEFLNETANVLGEVGIPELPSNEKRRALLNVLRGKRALLIYDNLETLDKDEQEALAGFLRDLPQGCKAIITSRRRGGEGAVWLRLERLEWDAARAIIEGEIERDLQLANKMRRVGESRWQELYDDTKGSPLALVHRLGVIRVRASLNFDSALTVFSGSPDPVLQKFIFQEARRELQSNDESVLRALSFFDPSATFEALMYVAQLTRNELELSIDRLGALSLVDVLLGEERYALQALTRNFVRDELLTDLQLKSEFEKRVTKYWSDYSQRNEVLRPSSLPETIQGLERLSWNYWWSWAADGKEVFRDLDPDVWEECEHNPRRLLSEVSEFRMAEMATNPVYIEYVRRLVGKFDRYMDAATPTWAQEFASEITHAHPVAYFCAEFGIHNSLPLYSGGLGMLAGDHLKSASDLGLPLVAIGLIYHHGYFRQRLRRDGWQEEHYGEIDTDELPLELVRSGDGERVLIELQVRGRTVRAQAWRVNVGRIALYLLDTNIPENDPTDQMITWHLYGGDREMRCVQEMVLGIGGVRLLRRLAIEPHVFHIHESHSAFLTLELVRERTTAGNSFGEAKEIVRQHCVFTMHTSVAASHDEFVPSLIELTFGEEYWRQFSLTREEFLSLGRVKVNDDGELFGLTPLALKMCRSTNGVSRKHGEVSRELWSKMWPGKHVDEVPITHVTNGVHAPTWVNPMLRSLYERHAGEDWTNTLHDPQAWARAVASISDEELWRVSRLLKRRLIAFIRQRLYHSRMHQGESKEYAEMARDMFDPDALTIGFARRVAAYKRWSLMLSDPERLLRLINDAERPVQLVFAGKAHPQDHGAKIILQQLAQWKLDPRVMHRAVFIQDYDQEIARQLVQSVDVWLNVPRRPLEACGTSGQKAAINGGLNLSILDGWWPEGYDGTNGWAVGDELSDSAAHDEDALDAESLYHVLETEVVPTFYERDERGISRRWVAMMKRAIQTLVPAFNSDRMVVEYTKRIYL